MQLSRYIKIYPCPDQPGKSLLYSTRLSSVVLADDATLLAAQEGTLAGEEAATLTRLGFLIPDQALELEEMRNIFITTNQKRRLFTAIAVLNLDCNLACPYCYEDQFRGRHYMTPETAEQLAESIQREHIEEGRDALLTFYGGEPLLSIPLIKAISARLQRAAAERGVSYHFNLVTNGTLLTRPVAEELVPLGLNGAKFTIDGPRETHDVSRPFVSGKGSFDSIVRNVKAVWDLVPVQIGGNFTRSNYREFPRLLDHLLAEGITPEKLTKVFFSPVVPKAGEKGVADFNLECVCGYEPWLREASHFLREEILRRGYTTSKPRLSACMVEFTNSLVVNYDGSLYKCPAFMAYDGLRIGSLAEGIGDYRASHNMDVWKKAECLDCPYLPLCFGGCRKMTLFRNGVINDVDCRREHYDAVLERIIRQDLEYQASGKG